MDADGCAALPRLDGYTEDARGRVPVNLRYGSVNVLGREVYTQLQLPAGLDAGRQGRMDGCCRGVPAALKPVPTGSHGPRVTVCDACAAPGSMVDMSSTLRACEGSITISTGIDRLTGPEQLGSSAVRSVCRRAAIVGSCGGHGHTWAWRPHCWCSACACMVLPCCMCSVCMHPVGNCGQYS